MFEFETVLQFINMHTIVYVYVFYIVHIIE